MNVSRAGVFAGNAGNSPPSFTALVDYFEVNGSGTAPSPDITPPQISGVSVSTTPTSATITWQTDEPSSSLVSYGPTVAFENGTITDPTLATSHTIVLSGLSEDSQYFFQVGSEDDSGNSAVGGVLSFATQAAGPAPTGPVSDEFNGALDSSVWTVLDPIGDSSVSTTGSQLAISVPSGSSHDLWRNALDAPRVLQPVADDDFEVVVKFDSMMDSKYQIQGIIVEQDSNDLIRFDFYHNGSNLKVFAAAFDGGQPSVKVNGTIPDAGPLFMRVRREGDLWTQSYSYDGASWSDAVVFTHSLTATSAGVFAGNAGGSPPGHTALIDYFRVSP